MTALSRIIIDKKKYVLVPEPEYKKLLARAPGLPPVDENGNRPAVAFADVAIAGNIVRDRKSVGLSQKDLAERAGIRVEVLNRAERGAVLPSMRTLLKIEKALVAAGIKRRG